MLGMPALVIWGIGSTFEADVDYLVKFGLFALLYIAVNGISMLTFDERLMNFLPLGIYMSTKAWIYYTWFATSSTAWVKSYQATLQKGGGMGYGYYFGL